MKNAQDVSAFTRTHVADVMNAHAIAVTTRTSYKQIAKGLHQHRVSAFPVIDDDHKVVGVVSAADLLTKEALAGGEPQHTHLAGARRREDERKAAGTIAAELMSAPPVTVGPDEPVLNAVRLMARHRVKRLPVVDAEGHLVGIISRTDALAAYRRPDEEIRQEVLRDVIADEFFMDPATLDVIVRDGIVTICSVSADAEVGHAIAGQVRHLEGVVAVRERVEERRL